MTTTQAVEWELQPRAMGIAMVRREQRGCRPYRWVRVAVYMGAVEGVGSCEGVTCTNSQRNSSNPTMMMVRTATASKIVFKRENPPEQAHMGRQSIYRSRRMPKRQQDRSKDRHHSALQRKYTRFRVGVNFLVLNLYGSWGFRGSKLGKLHYYFEVYY